MIGASAGVWSKFRITLPACFGVLSGALMVWDIHNQRIIESMGMAWDTGAPLWPYETPEILFFALNTPAYLVANPASRLLGLLGSFHYIVLFPVVLLWWWFVGIAFDRRLLKPVSHKGWIWLVLSAVLAMLFALAGVLGLRDSLRWWLTYSDRFLSWDNLILLRSSAPAIWWVVLGVVCGQFAVRTSIAKLSSASRFAIRPTRKTIL